MISDDKALAWFMVMQFQFDHDDSEHFWVPLEVRKAFAERGWYECEEEVDWQGRHQGKMTDKGRAILDLYGPEWGLDTIPEETEA